MVPPQFKIGIENKKVHTHYYDWWSLPKQKPKFTKQILIYYQYQLFSLERKKKKKIKWDVSAFMNLPIPLYDSFGVCFLLALPQNTWFPSLFSTHNWSCHFPLLFYLLSKPNKYDKILRSHRTPNLTRIARLFLLKME